ncbi:MAG: hypothetical protein H6737_20075 [Alphaproteobacteria bacterium]|nr:hypothetical protein [Alphaproteobacteria bacterium]
MIRTHRPLAASRTPTATAGLAAASPGWGNSDLAALIDGGAEQEEVAGAEGPTESPWWAEAAPEDGAVEVDHPGRPLDPAEREGLELQLGTDLGDLRIQEPTEGAEHRAARDAKTLVQGGHVRGNHSKAPGTAGPMRRKGGGSALGTLATRAARAKTLRAANAALKPLLARAKGARGQLRIARLLRSRLKTGRIPGALDAALRMHQGSAAGVGLANRLVKQTRSARARQGGEIFAYGLFGHGRPGQQKEPIDVAANLTLVREAKKRGKKVRFGLDGWKGADGIRSPLETLVAKGVKEEDARKLVGRGGAGTSAKVSNEMLGDWLRKEPVARIAERFDALLDAGWGQVHVDELDEKLDKRQIAKLSKLMARYDKADRLSFFFSPAVTSPMGSGKRAEKHLKKLRPFLDIAKSRANRLFFEMYPGAGPASKGLDARTSRDRALVDRRMRAVSARLDRISPGLNAASTFALGLTNEQLPNVRHFNPTLGRKRADIRRGLGNQLDLAGRGRHGAHQADLALYALGRYDRFPGGMSNADLARFIARKA